MSLTVIVLRGGPPGGNVTARQAQYHTVIVLRGSPPGGNATARQAQYHTVIVLRGGPPGGNATARQAQYPTEEAVSRLYLSADRLILMKTLTE